jgi:hypothetical protein
MYRKRKTHPTAKEIADALEKVREERKQNLFTSEGERRAAPPPFNLVNWIEIARADHLELPGTALMIVAWVLECGGGRQINAALARRWDCSQEQARKRIIDSCYECGWLSQALFGGEARRHQDKARGDRFKIVERTDPPGSGAPPS